MNSQPIGIFDSGIGGLTVFKEVVRLLPEEDIIYLGDMARLPYGTKSRETVIKYTLESARFLLKEGIKLLVVACNTASSVSLPVLRKELPIPVVGVVEAGARAAVKATLNNRIGVIGTRTTINSGAYREAIWSMNPSIHVIEQACPLFVPLVEEGWIGDEITFKVAKRYLAPLRSASIDTLVLGCTHYPLLKKVIQTVMGENVQLIDSAEETALEVDEIMHQKHLLSHRRSKKEGMRRFFVTDDPERFTTQGGLFLGEEIKDIHKVWIG